MAIEDETLYCNLCGAASPRWRPRCPECGQSGGMNAVGLGAMQDRDERGRFARGVRGIAARKPARLRSWIEGVDRVMGGDDPGFAVGTTTTFGGGQGSGKSTLALQALAGMSVITPPPPTLVVMSEEPEERLRLRADRCGITEKLDHVEAVEEKTFTGAQSLIREMNPRVVLVDSISMLVDPDYDTPDRQENLKRYLQWFFDDAAEHRRVTILISHLNKEDDFAGARFLQYLVDALIRVRRVDKRHVEMDCMEKNRWGDPAETARFLINKSGLHEIETTEIELPIADLGIAAPLADSPVAYRVKRR